MPKNQKKRSNINYRQTRSERSATNSARAYGQVQRMAGWRRTRSKNYELRIKN